MYAIRTPLVIPLARKATSGTTFTAKTEPLRQGDRMFLYHISVCNSTSDSKVAHIGFVRDEFPIYIKTVALTTHTYFYKTKLNLYVPSDYRIIIKLVTPTSGDMYYMNIFGCIEDDVKG